MTGWPPMLARADTTAPAAAFDPEVGCQQVSGSNNCGLRHRDELGAQADRPCQVSTVSEAVSHDDLRVARESLRGTFSHAEKPPAECRARGTGLAITLGRSECFLNYSSVIVGLNRID
jgi:hypothetical protein